MGKQHKVSFLLKKKKKKKKCKQTLICTSVTMETDKASMHLGQLQSTFCPCHAHLYSKNVKQMKKSEKGANIKQYKVINPQLLFPVTEPFSLQLSQQLCYTNEVCLAHRLHFFPSTGFVPPIPGSEAWKSFNRHRPV